MGATRTAATVQDPSRSHRELALAPRLGSELTVVKQEGFPFYCACFSASEMLSFKMQVRKHPKNMHSHLNVKTASSPGPHSWLAARMIPLLYRVCLYMSKTNTSS